MSDSDSDESTIPSRDACETRCQKFAEITGTDSAMAMFFLQDRKWDLDVTSWTKIVDITGTMIISYDFRGGIIFGSN